MFHGALITNAFLRTDKFTEHYEWLKKAAEKYKMTLSLFENTDLFYPVGQEDAASERIAEIVSQNDFVIYWDKDILQGKILDCLCRERGIRIFNPISAIGICDNKFETYQKLWEWNRSAPSDRQIPLIPTVAAPMTYENIGYTKQDFVLKIIQRLKLPLVIKECYGSFGMQVYLARTEEEVYDYTKRLEGTPFLYQKYLENSHGRDVRLQVVGNHVVAAMARYAKEGDFRANITNGGRMERYCPDKEECDLAVRTVQALGLDFAGVDLLFSKRDGTKADVVCEVNSNAHFKNIYACTGVNAADEILYYIREQLMGKRV